MLSLYFKNPFNNTRLENMSTTINASSYLDFLEGKHFRAEMLQFDYQNIIYNISEHVVNYWSVWRNSTSQLYTPTNYSFDQLRPTFAGFIAHRFYNCYGLKMPDDQEMVYHSALLRNDVFPSKIRPQAFEFITLLHYPNHLMKSLMSRHHNWVRRTANDTYAMQFIINDVEVVKRRYTNKLPCDHTGNDYDNSVLLKHSEAVGCRAPYYNANISKRMCSTEEEMSKAQFELRYDEYGNIPPCMTMEKISYSYKEIDFLNTKWEESIGHFWISIKIGNPKFKEIVQAR